MAKTLGFTQQALEALRQRCDLVRLADEGAGRAYRQLKMLEALQFVIALFQRKPF